jgi:hypothetical protein
MKLSTIQKNNNLNVIHPAGEPGPGGAYHSYIVFRADNDEEVTGIVQFQNGPRLAPDSKPGVLDTDLLEIVRDRLKSFQAGDYACRENACALTHIEEALMWMNKRVEDRAERGVLGTTQK